MNNPIHLRMNWLQLASKEWRRRPLRTAVTATGIAVAVAALFSLLSFHDGYRDGVQAEINRLGAHVLVVPKGCPYDAASMALHGANWPCYLSADHFDEVASVPGIASAAPALMAALHGSNGAQTVYVGVDERMFALKSGWKIDGALPRERGEIVAGSEVARVHGWKVGERVN
ncbi:MAG TPA: ABC transporter permease, partial [Candidatus Acidoferrum sp.]|nr:ABC transporter permease [Candidatus Acidoferrum sp.]